MAVAMHPSLTNCQAIHRPRTALAGITGRLERTIRLWRSRIRARRSFDYVDDRSLRDLGTSRWEFEREIAKPFWRD